MIRRLITVLTLGLILLLALPSAAFACGGLIAGKHAEVLRRATTLAAWHDGIEHYITGFEFGGSASSFGYIIPLPAVPSKIHKGGDWTLERLDREAFPRRDQFALAAAAPAPGYARVQVLQQVKIDSLDIKVVKGGGGDVAAWATEHGFDLTADTPSLLASYKANLFALAKFDVAQAGRRFVEGQGVVIDFEIPLPGPWIPLRILSLGKAAVEQVDAHLFLLTDARPVFTPAPSKRAGMTVVHDGWASDALIRDLRSDTNTQWVPESMWFTAIDMSAGAKSVTYDLATLGGIVPVSLPSAPAAGTWAWWLVVASLGAAITGILVRSSIRKPASS